MNTIKKLLLYTFITLFLMSVHKDLTIGTSLHTNPDSQNNTQLIEHNNISVLKIQVSKGDTVLSIVERINKHNSGHLNVSQILDDFKSLNHGMKPTHIKTGEYYYFPLY